MNDIDEQHAKRKRSKIALKRKREDAKNQSSSKLGLLVIFVCLILVSASIFISQQFQAKEKPEVTFIPADAIKVSAISTTWICPIPGDSNKGDSLIISNPDPKRKANVEISSFDRQGKKLGDSKLGVEQSSWKTFDISKVNSTPDSTVLIESFASSVVVYRKIALSDGIEYISCSNNLSSRSVFTNLITLRNSNSFLVLANPYDEAIVIDIAANLIDTSVSPPTLSADQLRGLIVPAKGRLDIDLQKEFGRHSLVGLDVTSRSGFFASEVLVSMSGAQSANGETIVHPSNRVSEQEKHYWTGISPTRISVSNYSSNAHSFGLNASALDKRSVIAEPKTVPPGSTLLLDEIGSDFQFRNLILEVEKGPNTSKAIFASWLRTQGDAVSGGSQLGRPFSMSFMPISSEDNLFLFNPNKSKIEVKVKIVGTTKLAKLEIEPGGYVSSDLAELAIENFSMIEISSSKPVVVSASDNNGARNISGIELKP